MRFTSAAAMFTPPSYAVFFHFRHAAACRAERMMPPFSFFMPLRFSPLIFYTRGQRYAQCRWRYTTARGGARSAQVCASADMRDARLRVAAAKPRAAAPMLLSAPPARRCVYCANIYALRGAPALWCRASGMRSKKMARRSGSLRPPCRKRHA